MWVLEMFGDRRRSLFLAAVLIGLAVCVVSVQAACDKGCDCLTPAEAEKLHYISCGEKPQVCTDTLSKTVKYCYKKPVTPAPVPVKCDEGCSCLDPVKATASGYQYCDTPHAVCNYDANNNPLYCFNKPELVTVLTARCADGCSCMVPEKATAAGYTFCNGQKVACDKDSAGNLRYCYGKPVTEEKTTVVPVSCAKGCSCMASAKAEPEGYTLCNKIKTVCGKDSAGNPLYCFSPRPKGTAAIPSIAVVKEKKVALPDKAEQVPKAVPARGGFVTGIVGSIFGWKCSPGETLCNDECVDLLSSSEHCGACNSPCASGEGCRGGECQELPGGGGIDCPSGQIPCGQECVNPRLDEDHCGDCGTACPDGYGCMDGTCCDPDGCPAPTAWCDGDCYDLQRSKSHCGTCDTRCESSQYCINGVCDVIGDRGAGCTVNELFCSGDCVDPRTDSANCGACGTVCPPGRECSGGSCVCAAGTTECARDPLGGLTPRKGWNTFCTDTKNDEDNCGECGHRCSSTKVCRNGQCTCREGEVYCDSCPEGEPSCDVPCVDFTFDPDHCGNCNRRCQDPTPDCCYGQCTNLLTDENNCGYCRWPGTLSSTCASGLTCCDGQCVNINTNMRNCGECGHDCGASGFCCNRMCSWPYFEPGWDECSACGLTCDPDTERCCDGRCVNIREDENNCGGCGVQCRSGETCCPDGHCRNLQTNTLNCGSCGHECGPIFHNYCRWGYCCMVLFGGTNAEWQVNCLGDAGAGSGEVVGH